PGIMRLMYHVLYEKLINGASLIFAANLFCLVEGLRTETQDHGLSSFSRSWSWSGLGGLGRSMLKAFCLVVMPFNRDHDLGSQGSRLSVQLARPYKGACKVHATDPSWGA